MRNFSNDYRIVINTYFVLHNSHSRHRFCPFFPFAIFFLFFFAVNSIASVWLRYTWVLSWHRANKVHCAQHTTESWSVPRQRRRRVKREAAICIICCVSENNATFLTNRPERNQFDQLLLLCSAYLRQTSYQVANGNWRTSCLWTGAKPFFFSYNSMPCAVPSLRFEENADVFVFRAYYSDESTTGVSNATPCALAISICNFPINHHSMD